MAPQTHHKPKKDWHEVASYHYLRRSIGIMGIVLPFILVIGLWMSGVDAIQNSISAYYHTICRNVFVAIMCSYAFFLFAYNGYAMEDKVVAKLASFFALCVVFFPMDAWDMTPMICEPKYYGNRIGEISNALHHIAAILFLLMLAYFSILIFTKTEDEKDHFSLWFKKRSRKPKREKRIRNRFHRICGFTILGTIVLLAIYWIYHDRLNYQTIFDPFKPILILECIALWAFGFSWLLKGFQSEQVDSVLKRTRKETSYKNEDNS